MVVKVVTDSTSDLPADVARELGIIVVPLNVHFGDQTYRDGVDLAPDEFYQRLLAGPVLPTTSQPSVGAFLQVYQELAQRADAIVSVHISSKLSGTWNSAMNAQDAYEGGCRIEVVDTPTASMGIGLLAMAAARLARGGASVEEVVGEVQRMLPAIHCLFTLDTLEYLEKGGRIGKAQALLGSVLRIKPILCVRDGEVHPLERVRTRAKAVERLLGLAQGLSPVEAAAVMYSTGAEEAEAQECVRRMASLCVEGKVTLGRFGPVLGTYVGPGGLGIAVRTRE